MTTRTIICWTYLAALVLLPCGCGLFKVQAGSASRPAVEGKADIKAEVKGNAQIGSNADKKQIVHGDNNKFVDVNVSWLDRVMEVIAGFLGGLVMGWVFLKRPGFMERTNANGA